MYDVENVNLGKLLNKTKILFYDLFLLDSLFIRAWSSVFGASWQGKDPHSSTVDTFSTYLLNPCPRQKLSNAKKKKT